MFSGDAKKIQKGKRVFYKARANYKGPLKVTWKTRLNIDKKPKMLTARIKGDYNFVKIFKWAKDSFSYNSKIVNKSTKTYKNVDINS